MSGGKDSTALAVYMRDRQPDMEYVFCDTEKELQETYDYLAKVEAYLGKPVIRLNDERGFDHWLEVYGHYLPSPQMRWCTRQLKIRPVRTICRRRPGDQLHRHPGGRAPGRLHLLEAEHHPSLSVQGRRHHQARRIPHSRRIGIGGARLLQVADALRVLLLLLPAQGGMVGPEGQPSAALPRRQGPTRKTDPETGRRFTWSQSESLDELARPERADEIRRRHLKVLQTEKTSRPDRPLIEVVADSLDQENDGEGCLICHL